MNEAWASVFVLALATPAAAQVRAVALSGDAVPGNIGRIDRVREVVPLGGNRAAYRAYTTEAADVILIDDASGTDVLIAAEATTAPGGGIYGPIANLTAGGGNFAFTSTVNGKLTVFAWTPTTGVRRMLGVGDALPSTRTVTTITTFTINALGQVLVDGKDTVLVEPTGTVRSILHLNGPVPGDTGYTVTAGAGRLLLSDDGDVTLGVRGTDGTFFRTYVLHGPPGTAAIARSTASLPNQSGDVALMAASSTGLIAFREEYTTAVAGPTIAHTVIKTGAAGAETEAFHGMDTTQIMVGGRPVDALLLTRAFLHETSGLIAQGSTGIVRHAAGSWSSIHFFDEVLPGEAGARPSTLAAVGSGGQVVLTAGIGDTTSVYVWTPAGGLSRLVQTLDEVNTPGGALVRLTQIALDDTPISSDGAVGFAAAYNAPGGGTAQGGFISGAGGGLTTDLVVTTTREPERGIASFDVDFVRFAIAIKNRSAVTVAVDLTLQVVEGTFLRRGGCWEITGALCTCVNGVCSAPSPLAPDASVELHFAGDGDARAATVRITATTQSARELAPDDNTLELTVPSRSSGGCAVSHGGSPVLLVGLLLAGALVRRRHRSSTRASALREAQKEGLLHPGRAHAPAARDGGAHPVVK